MKKFVLDLKIWAIFHFLFLLHPISWHFIISNISLHSNFNVFTTLISIRGFSVFLTCSLHLIYPAYCLKDHFNLSITSNVNLVLSRPSLNHSAYLTYSIFWCSLIHDNLLIWIYFSKDGAKAYVGMDYENILVNENTNIYIYMYKWGERESNKWDTMGKLEKSIQILSHCHFKATLRAIFPPITEKTYNFLVPMIFWLPKSSLIP